MGDYTMGDASPAMPMRQSAGVPTPHPFGMPSEDSGSASSQAGRSSEKTSSFQQVVLQLEALQQRLVEAHAQELESLQQDLRTLRGEAGDAQAVHQGTQSSSPHQGTQSASQGTQSATLGRVPSGEDTEYHIRACVSQPAEWSNDQSATLRRVPSGEDTEYHTRACVSKPAERSNDLAPLRGNLGANFQPSSNHGGLDSSISHHVVGTRGSVLIKVQELSSHVEAVAHTLSLHKETKVSFNLHAAWGMDDDQMLVLKCEQLAAKRAKLERRLADTHTMDLAGDADSRWILHPSSRGKLLWDILLLAFLGYDLVTVPMQVYDLQAAALRVMDILVVLFWTFDTALTFFTGVYVDGVLEMQTSTIARQYVYSWFFFDFLVLVPEWVSILAVEVGEDIPDSMSMIRALRVRRFIRLLRFLKLLRIMKVKNVLDGLKTRIGTPSLLLGMSIGKLSLVTMMLVHDLACLWFFVGNAQGGWVYGIGLQERPFQEQYFQSFQWSLSRLHPSTMTQNMALNLWQEQALAVLAVVLAMTYSSVFISSITNLMLDMKRLRDKRNHKIAAFREYAARHGISTMLSIRLTRYLERDHDNKRQQQTEMELQQALPQELLKELFHEARSPILSAHSFFESLGEKHRRVERDLCLRAVSEVHFLAHDRIFSEGDSCSSMYFVSAGDLSYTVSAKGSERSVADVKQKESLARRWKYVRSDTGRKALEAGERIARGDWASEPVLWLTRWEHKGDLWANADGSFVTIRAEDFAKVVQNQKSALIDVTIYARCFVEELAASGQMLSDLALPDETQSTRSRSKQRFSFRRKATRSFLALGPW
ncbi:unnamed protein product [Polarella glacialis]|uniref:Cyclic nucleotide-binding domain-containing protein n=1 Tax=Polarella glacialis TaxID=89957 RepID=A0A813GKT1_POLGL|nr:unnamed protein product [Polarella glacialis]